MCAQALQPLDRRRTEGQGITFEFFQHAKRARDCKRRAMLDEDAFSWNWLREPPLASNGHRSRQSRPYSQRPLRLQRLFPRRHEYLRDARDVLDARAGSIERRANAEAVRAGAPVWPDALGRDAADRKELRLFR